MCINKICVYESIYKMRAFIHKYIYIYGRGRKLIATSRGRVKPLAEPQTDQKTKAKWSPQHTAPTHRLLAPGPPLASHPIVNCGV